MLPTRQKASFGKRMAWLLLIWLGSIAALTLVSLIIKLLMKAAGFHS